MPGVGIAEEEPVLFAQSGRSNGVFHEIVVELETTIFEIDTQQRPIGERVIDSLAERAARQIAARLFEEDQSMIETLANGTTLAAAHGGPFPWPCLGAAQVLLDAVMESLKQVSRELHEGLNTMATERNLSPRLTGYGTQVMNGAVVLGFQLAERYDSHMSAPLVHYIRIVGPNLELVDTSYAITYERSPTNYPEPYYEGRLADTDGLQAAVNSQKHAIFAALLRELNRLLEAEAAK